MQTIHDLLAQHRPILYDGATGTLLQQFGLPIGTAPETWVLEQPALVFAAAEAYVNVGAQIILTCTFGGTAARLRDAGLEDQAREVNQRAAQLAKEAARGRALVAGSIGPIGNLPLALIAMSYTEAVHQFADQARALAEGGVDLLQIESMSDLRETQAAIQGARSETDLPIFATMSFDTNGKTSVGVTPAQAAQELTRLGVTALGANCGHGPWDIAAILREMRDAVANAMLIAKPNAGTPMLSKDKAVYPVDPAHFALLARDWVRAGAKIIGGCCGTTPEYIAAIRAEIGEPKPTERSRTLIF